MSKAYLAKCPYCKQQEVSSARYDARGIFLTYCCQLCWPIEQKRWRHDVLTDPHYWVNEPIDEDN